MQRTFQTQDLRRVIRRTYEKPDMRQLTLNRDAGLRYKLAYKRLSIQTCVRR